ncbi:MAG: hypothetical protein DRP46_03190 [Candidatus Zixiibacteriota bacterium]|nr:MAG: hypothetical protein DRP46_03190 [candidate division Zixibacteria bacterium]HDL03372.1 hypothetical protein [candidate division Zixibacteria bacterium]
MKPNLRIVKLADIVPLMEYESAKVDYLISSFEQTGTIRNPFALASVSKSRYLMLENSSPLEAARRIKIEHIPAQVIPFKKALKFTADLAASDVLLADLKRFSDMFPRSFYAAEKTCEDKNDRRWTVVRISKKNVTELDICFPRNSSGRISPELFTFLRFLGKRWSYSGAVQPARIKAVNVKAQTDRWLMRVINLEADDLLYAADRGFLFPRGLLKFNYGHRLIGIDYPIDILKEPVPLNHKEQFLHDLVNMRLNSGFYDYIKSGVYLLNY